MNEDKIIETLNDYIKSPYKCDNCKYCSGQRNTQKAIEEIIDLYQKEKEKNKELQSTINLLYISKGNIRELLEKYDKDIAWNSTDDRYYFTKFIQELLEENNGKND